MRRPEIETSHLIGNNTKDLKTIATIVSIDIKWLLQQFN